MSSSRSTRQHRTARSATSPPSAIRRRSANTSRSPWSRAARRGTARAPSSPTRCASALARSRSSAIISSTPKGAACMVEQQSPLEPVWKPGAHGKVLGGAGVVLEETQPGSIVQAAAFPGEETDADRRDPGGDRPRLAGRRRRRRRRRRQVRLRHRARTLPGGRPGRRRLAPRSRPRCRLRSAPSPTCRMAARRSASPARSPNGCWRNSSRSIFRCRPFPKAPAARPPITTSFAQIQRTGPEQFDLYVFRSFARSFWTALCHASEEVGYEVR